MLRTLKAKRIDLPDGQVLYRNIYRVTRRGYDYWKGQARIQKMYRDVYTHALQIRLEEATWKPVA